MVKHLLLTIGIGIFLALNPEAQNRPNILLILADDMGYSDIGCYGGEIQTPNIDRLAKEGIRYRQFYNMARCCPTRASLLTGLYPHQAGMGWMAAADLGTPAYQGNLNNQCVTIAEVLKSSGYKTYMTGKWHLTNERKIDGGVMDNWPVQRGFDKYFGIIQGAANYFTPVVYNNNGKRKVGNDEGFYLTDAISDSSVGYINQHFSNTINGPMFMYVAYNAPHWPLQAPKETIRKYKQQYLQGWDLLREKRFARQQESGLISANAVLSPRDTSVPAWESLTSTQKDEMASRMAIYAAQVDIMDAGIGRIVNALKANNQLDNTLILFLSDNGACAEFVSGGDSKLIDGSADTWESYRINWANLSSTPFRKYKHYTHEGGIATPLIVHWPKGIARNLENTYATGNGNLPDIMATCVDVAGAKYPRTYHGNIIQPMEGISLQPHFSGKANHKGKMFWEHEANIAVRDGKWKLVATTDENAKLDTDKLELYDTDADPTEMTDLKSTFPARAENMYHHWLKFAKRIHAFPLDTRGYGARMQAYRRIINGEFNDNLGGWTIRIHDKMGKIMIDSSGQISGKNAAIIETLKKGDRPSDMAMLWSFPASKGERFRISLKIKGSRSAGFYLRLEKADQPSKKILDEKVGVSGSNGSHRFTSGITEAKGAYQLALYFGGLSPGERVWVDEVSVEPIK